MCIRDRLCLAIIAWAIPIEINAQIVEEPPSETNNIGTPVIGIKPETPPKLINKWKKKYEAIPSKIILDLFSLTSFEYFNNLKIIIPVGTIINAKPNNPSSS